MVNMKNFQSLFIFIVLFQLSYQASIKDSIANDRKVSIKDYPYQIFTFTKLKQTDLGMEVNQCGGSLISKNHVLTAGHCVITRKKLSWVKTPIAKFYLVAGISNTSGSNLHSAVQPDKIILHPKFDVKYIIVKKKAYVVSMQNDIAIIHVKKPFEFSRNIAKIRLPMQNERDSSLRGKTAVVTGYGVTSNDLYALNLTIPKNSQCDKGLICINVKKNQRAVCRGDSGGPLVIDGIQYGISSSLILDKKKPACQFAKVMRFTSVTYHLKWISKNADINNEDDSEEHDDDSKEYDNNSEEHDDGSEDHEDNFKKSDYDSEEYDDEFKK